MKLSDVIAQFLAEQGIRHVFAVSGGASLHLIHSLADTQGIEFVCPAHEQGGAMAADAYARVTGSMGCAVATSGPGATNMITGICSSYYDSVPVLYLTGQVATFRAKGDSGVRQIGFQETDIVDICRSITKYVVLVKDPYRVRYELAKAVAIAKSGRPGPVVVDVPDDLQRMDIDPSKLIEYRPEAEEAGQGYKEDKESIASLAARCLDAVQAARRPVMVVGWGVHLAGVESETIALAHALGMPVVMTWAARDIFPESDPLAIGGFGTHGVRYANFAVQNADLILSLGSRLDTKATGSPPSTFARDAKIIMVDIDSTEIGKFGKLGRKIDVEVCADAGAFVREMLRACESMSFPDLEPWVQRIRQWKEKYPVCSPLFAEEEPVNPYWFIKQLSAELKEEEIIFSDTGCALAWMMQGFEFKKGQRFFHAFNNTPMGYGLPGAIGACFARPGQRVVLISGDGSLQMSIQEMATVARHNLPIKILMFNNHGHGMVRQTQEMWLGGHYHATSVDGGLPDPDFLAIAGAYGFKADKLERGRDVTVALKRSLESDGPAFLNVEIAMDSKVVPQVKYGRPNEDADPLLTREEFLSNMIVPALPVSLKN